MDQVHFLNGLGQHGGFQLLELQVLGIGGNVVGGGFQARVLLQLNEAQVLEQQQGTALVGGIIGHGDDSPVGDLFQRGGFAGVDAHGLVVDGAGVHQVGVVFCVIGFHVSDVLEEVSVILPFLHSNVGGEIVGVRDNLQGDALGGQGVHDLLQNLLVGGRGGANPQGNRFAGCLSLRGVFIAGSSAGVPAAGGQAQAQGQRHGQCKKLLHGMGSSLK